MLGASTHQEVILGVKSDTENGCFVTPECFRLAAVRHLHHLNHEVTEKWRKGE